ncbi:MAG: translation initiation factor IF-2 [Syntrophaceae bacterium CG2_30_49_12]|nr:MAG: translation initiation factor IF-2 [Syntrophaceae bacterium CG2_30_49_12]PJC72817.1 MAG: translation initiation factor IF-2 [Syntrophobacterales bacterium CG_4_8_14_3_um_filter_49_14]
MPKKRVYELARELGLDNREIISRLERLGVAVKSHSSTIEDSDVQRIKGELSSGESLEMVEKRIKSTVIRRRTVRHRVDEIEPEAVEEVVPAPPEEKEVEAPPEEVTPIEATPEAEEKLQKESMPVRTAEESKPEEGAGEARSTFPPIPVPVSIKVKKEEPVRPEKREAFPVHIPQKARIEIKKETPERPKLVVVKEVIPPKGEKQTKKKEAPQKQKWRKPVEVLIKEQLPIRKKVFVKKIVGKRDRRLQKETEEERIARRREEEKKMSSVKMKKTVITVPKAIKRRIKVGEAISVGDLARKMAVKATEVIRKLIPIGMMVTINQSIDRDVATIVASEFGYQVEPIVAEYGESMQKVAIPQGNLKPRAPVVTIMGHVDHGKTSLLDAIRQTNVIDGEAGGITQAIGAYHVHIKDRDIVFLDTPGHEAFTAMRARGAQVTDIVVLVIAADDGVMDQTIEAINHSKVAGVPIVVAINKIDKPNADPGKIKQALTEYSLVPEEWGGDTIFCEMSAKKKTGIEELLEMILLQADVMELKADHEKPARGVVIEAKLDRGRGPVATVLIQEGTLREGDAFVSKTEAGRVRAMINDQGKRIKEAPPSMPVEVIGFSGVPHVGAEFTCMEDEKRARSIGEYWLRKERERELSTSAKITLEQLYQKIKEGSKEFNVIIKGDVQGSIEALNEALNKLSTTDVKLKTIHSSTGAITETDVMLASASNAIIIGFNVRPTSRVIELAEAEGVEIKLYDIIYNVIADVKAAMEGLLEPVYKEVVQGRAEVRQLFKIPRVGTIAGSYVTDGKITRKSNLKLVRDGVTIYDGKLLSLKRFNEDVKEVQSGFECGIGIEGFNNIRGGDIIESYINEKVERNL